MPSLRRSLILALLLLVAWSPATRAAGVAEVAVKHTRLAASLFGETVGEVHLSLQDGATGTLTYRSDLQVVRNKSRLRQQAFIEVTFDEKSGQLIRSIARRCSGPSDGSSDPVCTPPRNLAHVDAAPALAAEMLLARQADGAEHCLDVVDEETGLRGPACGVGKRTGSAVDLAGSKLGELFQARIEDGALVNLELPHQGARFARATGAIEISDDDLFAEPIPASGDAASAIRRGLMRVQFYGAPQALKSLEQLATPGQTVVSHSEGSLILEIKQVAPPKDARTRRLLDKAALLVAKAAGGHADCQAATAWFISEAHRRHWKVRPAFGLAYVDGRFAFHSWAVIDSPQGSIPVDPLLAQVPADAGHVQLAAPGDAPGTVLVSFHRGLSLSVE